MNFKKFIDNKCQQNYSDIVNITKKNILKDEYRVTVTENIVIDNELDLEQYTEQVQNLFDGYLGEQREVPNPLEYGPNATYRNLREGVVYKKGPDNLWEMFVKDGQNGKQGAAGGSGTGVNEVKQIVNDATNILIDSALQTISKKCDNFVGDGVTDNYDLFKSLIKSNTKIKFPSGVFYISKQIDFDTSIGNLSIEGIGASDTILKISSHCLIGGYGTSSVFTNIKFENICISGTFNNSTEYGAGMIYFIDVGVLEDITFKQCKFTNVNDTVGGIGVYVNSGSNTVINRFNVNNCEFYNIGRMAIEIANNQLSTTELNSAANVIIENNYFNNFGTKSIHKQAVSVVGVSKGVIKNNYFISNTSANAIESVGCDIIDNCFDYQNGIFPAIVNRNNIYGNNRQKTRITGNRDVGVFSGVRSYWDILQCYGTIFNSNEINVGSVRVQSSSAVVLSNNIFRNNVKVLSATDIVFSNNIVEGNYNPTVQILSPSKILITNNILTQDVSVDLSASSTVTKVNNFINGSLV